MTLQTVGQLQLLFFLFYFFADSLHASQKLTLIALVSLQWLILTNRIHSPGLVDEEVVLLLAQLVAQAKCNAAAWQRGAPWTA